MSRLWTRAAVLAFSTWVVAIGASLSTAGCGGSPSVATGEPKRPTVEERKNLEAQGKMDPSQK